MLTGLRKFLDYLNCRSKCCNIEIDSHHECETKNCENCGENIHCFICKQLCHACLKEKN